MIAESIISSNICEENENSLLPIARKIIEDKKRSLNRSLIMLCPAKSALGNKVSTQVYRNHCFELIKRLHNSQSLIRATNAEIYVYLMKIVRETNVSYDTAYTFAYLYRMIFNQQKEEISIWDDYHDEQAVWYLEELRDRIITGRDRDCDMKCFKEDNPKRSKQ